MKIFIADGSTYGLRRLLTLLSDLKEFELVGFSPDVNAAIISILSVRPQAVILDLDMRGKNGMDILSAVKRERPEILFIIATNSTAEQYRKRCKSLGAEFFLDKSTEFAEIPLIIKSISNQLKELSTNGKSRP